MTEKEWQLPGAFKLVENTCKLIQKKVQWGKRKIMCAIRSKVHFIFFSSINSCTKEESMSHFFFVFSPDFLLCCYSSSA